MPGLLQGGIGWQGIVPARAAKMGSIAVDKAIAKLGTPAEFYQQLEPDRIAEHIVTVFRPEIPELVDEVMRREHPRLWRDLPRPVRQAVVDRVQSQLPAVVGGVTDEIGIHIDQLLDPKIMVIDHFRNNPSLVVRIFRDFGQRELEPDGRLRVRLRLPARRPGRRRRQPFGQWWLLPILGVVVGWITNALGMWLIFEPPEPRRVLGIKVHGLFLRRQDEAAEVYAQIIADDVITLERIGDFLLDGPRGDRTRQMLADRPAPGDRQGGGAGAGRGPGRGRHPALRHHPRVGGPGRGGPHDHAVQGPGLQPPAGREDPGAGGARTKELPPRDFVEMMRAAIREDEWMLYAHGAIMGLAGGFLHLWLFGVGG